MGFSPWTAPFMTGRGEVAGMAEEGDAEVVTLLSDEYNQRILEHTRAEPRPVSALSELCDADPSTIYRRLDDLEAEGLVEGRTRIDPDGHHYTVYAATLREVLIRLEADGFEVEIDLDVEESPADRFTRLYEGFK